jgi:hypothetical protein
MKRSFVVIVALVLLLAPRLAVAQIEQGRIIGAVTDAQGAVLPGATVTAKSPALIGTRAVVTESDGGSVFRRCRRAPMNLPTSFRDSRPWCVKESA